MPKNGIRWGNNFVIYVIGSYDQRSLMNACRESGRETLMVGDGHLEKKKTIIVMRHWLIVGQ